MIEKVLSLLFKILLFFGAIMLCVQCSSNMFAVTLNEVIIAIEKVESNQNPYAINKKENALGCLQIRPIMIADYNRITGQDLPHDVAFNRAMAYMIIQEIFFHYMKGIEKPNAKHLAFIWNGGGSAWRRVDTPKNDRKQEMLESYWIKVQKHL